MSGKTSKSLKEQNRWQLWLAIAVNVAIFLAVVRGETFLDGGLKAAVANAAAILPVGLAALIATVANGLISPDMKARLVFLRWREALPGHRAFSVYAQKDARIDTEKLKQVSGGALPIDAAEQNRVWYRLYKTVDAAPAVTQVHRDFLLVRDYASLSLMFLLLLAPLSAVLAPTWSFAAWYCLFLVCQLGAAILAAANYGIRFVKTVLAIKAAVPESNAAPRGKRKPRALLPS